MKPTAGARLATASAALHHPPMHLARALDIVESWSPGHRRELKPASLEDILEVEQLSTTPMHPDQRELLATLGGAEASLFRGFVGMNVLPATLREFYQREGLRLRPPLSLIGCDRDSPVLTVLVDEPGREHPRVAHHIPAGVLGAWARPDEHPLEWLSESLGALVVNCAFFNFVAYRFEHELYGRVLDPEAGDRDRIDETLRAVGFSCESVPVDTHRYHRHELAAALCSQIPEDDPIQFYAFSDDPAILERLALAVSEHVELEVHHVWPVADLLDPVV